MAVKSKNKKKAEDYVLAQNPARAPWRTPWRVLEAHHRPVGDRPATWHVWIPDDEPRAKGNSKHIVYPGGFKSGRPPILVGSKNEQHHEKALRATIRRIVESNDLLAMTCLPEGGHAFTLDIVVDLPLPVMSAEFGPAWRDLALNGDPTKAPGANEDGTPDRGNLAKMIEDAAANVLGFKNDRQVVTGIVAKRWSLSPGWHLRLLRSTSGVHLEGSL